MFERVPVEAAVSSSTAVPDFIEALKAFEILEVVMSIDTMMERLQDLRCDVEDARFNDDAL